MSSSYLVQTRRDRVVVGVRTSKKAAINLAARTPGQTMVYTGKGRLVWVSPDDASGWREVPANPGID